MKKIRIVVKKGTMMDTLDIYKSVKSSPDEILNEKDLNLI